MENQNYSRILAIDLSTRGFGFALLDGQNTLCNWGAKRVQSDVNNWCVERIRELIAHNKPDIVVIQNLSAKNTRRSQRIKVLSKRIIAVAAQNKVEVRMLTREEVMLAFFGENEGTKYEIAKGIAAKYSDELGFLLPPERKAWMNEDYRMDVFDAVALALTLRRMQKSGK